MKSSNESIAEKQGRVIARAMHAEKVQRQKNMAKAAQRRSTMLKNAAEKALSGGNE